MQKVPVYNNKGKPIMPTRAIKARILLKKGRAKVRWNKGVFGIQMLDIEEGETQPIVAGVDTGSKKEAITVKSEAHTFINIQMDAVTWVKRKLEIRRNARRNRRQRKTPYRANRTNRAQSTFPPSTKARWQLKLRVLNWLASMYPIDTVVIEDIKAKIRKGQRRWNKSFSPLQVGKKWMYSEIAKRWRLHTYRGYETFEERQDLGLKKLKDKMSNSFYAHCVDSWCLANMWIGGHIEPDNTQVHLLAPLNFHRRSLHRQNPQRGGIRPAYGSTRSLGLKRGTLVRHTSSGRGRSHDLSFVGGNSKLGISLHSSKTGKRLTQAARLKDIQLLAFMSWRFAVCQI